MKTSSEGINLIKQFEGYRKKAYICPAGRPTIGYGTTVYPSGKKVKLGQTCTKKQATTYLKNDLVRFEKNVNKYMNTYNFNQNEFDALVVFAYNIGSIDGLTAKGTRTKKEISSKMLEYNKATVNKKKVVLTGLDRRRKAEQKLFLK